MFSVKELAERIIRPYYSESDKPRFDTQVVDRWSRGSIDNRLDHLRRVEDQRLVNNPSLWLKEIARREDLNVVASIFYYEHPIAQGVGDLEKIEALATAVKHHVDWTEQYCTDYRYGYRPDDPHFGASPDDIDGWKIAVPKLRRFLRELAEAL